MRVYAESWSKLMRMTTLEGDVLCTPLHLDLRFLGFEFNPNVDS